MRLLPDTRSILWLGSKDPRLSETARELLGDNYNECLLSAVVVWEIEIKRSLGKLRPPKDLFEELVAAGASPLPITLGHAKAVGGLPWHHRDPFDRLLVAQAQVEEATVLSVDPVIGRYGVSVAW